MSMLCCQKGGYSSLTKTVRTDMLATFSADMNSYSQACEEVPDLKVFDSSLQKRTNEVISSLGAGTAENEYFSLDKFVNALTFVLKTNEDVLSVLIQSKDDLSKNKDLSNLVDLYFKSTAKTLDLCNSVAKCVTSACKGQLIIRYAVEQFEKESLKAHGARHGKKTRYAKTLEELNKFKAMGDPFGRDCFKPLVDLYEDQVSYLEVLGKMRKKLGKKQKKSKALRILSNVVFATAFASVLVLSVVAAATGAPPVVAAVVAALAPPIGYVGKWFNKVWKEYEEAIKRQRGLVLSLESSTDINIKAMETINKQVDKLRITIESIHENVGFALERKREEATRLAMQEIKNGVDEFSGKIREVGETTARCSKCIANGRVTVLQYISS